MGEGPHLDGWTQFMAWLCCMFTAQYSNTALGKTAPALYIYIMHHEFRAVFYLFISSFPLRSLFGA